MPDHKSALLQRRVAAALVGAALCLSVVPAVAAGVPTARVVAGGLDNPRGIAVGANGNVLVAEAGAGRVLQIRGTRVTTFAAGLPHSTSPEGETTGVVNVALRGNGNAVAAIGGGPQGLDPRFDTVLRLSPRSGRIVADIQAYRNAHPDLTDIDQPPNATDSNAYGLALLSGSRALVTDAAGNELHLIGPGGRIQTVAKFPNALIATSLFPPEAGFPPELPAEAVPTSVAVGPDGWWYVGELKGFPFTSGASRVWRISPHARNVLCDPTATSGPCTVFADNLTSITGLDFGPDGSMYVVEIVKNSVFNLFSGGDITGALIRIRNGVRTELVPGQLHAPGDVAVARNGTIYVTNLSISPDGGQVLAIR